MRRVRAQVHNYTRVRARDLTCINAKKTHVIDKSDTGGEENMPELKYKSEAAFLRASRKYLASIKFKVERKDERGKPIYNMLGEPLVVEEYAVPPNTLDWARYLKINKQTLTQAYKERYPDAYAEIKGELEAYNARELVMRDRVDGIKFNLINNYGWKDSKRIGLEEDTAQAMAVASNTDMSLEEKLSRIEELKKGLDDG